MFFFPIHLKDDLIMIRDIREIENHAGLNSFQPEFHFDLLNKIMIHFAQLLHCSLFVGTGCNHYIPSGNYSWFSLRGNFQTVSGPQHHQGSQCQRKCDCRKRNGLNASDLNSFTCRK